MEMATNFGQKIAKFRKINKILDYLLQKTDFRKMTKFEFLIEIKPYCLLILYYSQHTNGVSAQNRFKILFLLSYFL